MIRMRLHRVYSVVLERTRLQAHEGFVQVSTALLDTQIQIRMQQLHVKYAQPRAYTSHQALAVHVVYKVVLLGHMMVTITHLRHVFSALLEPIKMLRVRLLAKTPQFAPAISWRLLCRPRHQIVFVLMPQRQQLRRGL